MNGREMGGYLPLELPQHSFPWSKLNRTKVLEVNTGRTAIWCAVQSLQTSRLFLPAYYCPDVIDMLRQFVPELVFYQIGPDLLPTNLPKHPNGTVLLVNYFGVLTEQLSQLSQMFPKVILDQAHGFFAPPILREGCMNVYSCRKFLGVSDGALLVGMGIDDFALETDSSWSRSIHLLKCYETGTNGAYEEHKAAESSLEGFRLMSPLTRRILEGIDYTEICSRRRKNTEVIHRILAEIQLLPLELGDNALYLYPLLLKRDIHRELVSRSIYVPYLWAHLLGPKWNETQEQIFTRNLIPLPIDQRYTPEDMEWLASTVMEVLRG